MPTLASRAFAVAAVVAVGAAAPSVAAPSARPACATPHLVVWLNTAGDGAAGSIYYHLEFTNVSGHACTLSGFPGVSAVTLAGRQVGSAATRNPVKVRTVTLARGKTAAAVLRIVEAENYPASRCHPVLAAGLRVYPPGARGSRIVPFPLRACASREVSVLDVGPVLP